MSAETAETTQARSSGAPAAPEPHVRDSRARDADADGWITASPPRLVEVLRRVLTFPRLVLVHRDLVTTSVQRELRARFTGTVLGLFWPLLHPIFMFAVYYFIFTKLLAFKMPDLPPDQESAMGVYMFIGVAIWASFADSLTRGCSVIVDNGNLIKKVAFPSETLPLNIVAVNVVTMLFAVGAFLIAAVATPIWIPPDPLMLLWIPVLLAVQVVFTYGLALLLATLYVFLRDTLQVVTILVTIWMFITPVFWVPEVIAEIDPYLPMIKGNPMYDLVYAWRVVLMSSEPSFAFTGDIAGSVARFAVWSVVSFVVGYTFFILSQRRFADEV